MYDVRPLSSREILARALQIVRDDAGLLVGIALIPYAPMAVLEEITRGMDGPDDFTGPFASVVLATFALVLVLTPLAGGAITWATARACRDVPTGMGEAWRESLRLGLPLVGTSLLVGLAVALGALALILPGIYLAVAFLLVTPVIVLERSAGTDAMARSLRLLRGHMLQAFGFALGWVVAIVGLSGAVTLALGDVPVVGPLVGVLVQSVALATYTALMTVFYLDVACRKEGIDDAHLAQLVTPPPDA